MKVTLLIPIALVVSGSCQRIEDTIRNWGMRQRSARVDRIEVKNVDHLERDLNLTRARARELEQQMQTLISESRLRGRLSWQLARKFCMDDRHEVGIAYAKAAIKGQAPQEAGSPADSLFERSLPFFREALAHSAVEPNLLFDAALCYANASRALGWEKDRFQTAVLLLESLRRLEPRGTRADYQLALLIGKTTNPQLRDLEGGVRLLEGVVSRDEYNIAARFALAHFHVTAGKWTAAVVEYQLIQQKMRDLQKRGNLPVDPTTTPQFRQAGKNIEQLQACMNDRASCEIMRGSEP